MSEGSTLPSTESFDVTRLAITFEIAKSAMAQDPNSELKPEEYAERYAKIFLTTWKTIIERKESSIK